jgi:hypothetical protein
MIDPIRVSKYSNRILDLIDNSNDYTRSDLQGLVDVVVINIIAEVEAETK